MTYRLDEALSVLERTPGALRALLSGLPDPWTEAREGEGTWSPYDVIGHLIHGERTDWVPRIEHFFRHGDSVPFPPFDREAMFTASRGAPLEQLLGTFAEFRVVHDLSHVAQIARVMAARYAGDVGPWSAYLRILRPARLPE